MLITAQSQTSMYINYNPYNQKIRDMKTYRIDTNMNNDTFGCFHFAVECRNVAIDELKKYQFRACDIRSLFIQLSSHICAQTFYYRESESLTIATAERYKYYIKFVPVKEGEEGLLNYDFNKFCDMLHKDYEEGRCSWDYVRSR